MLNTNNNIKYIPTELNLYKYLINQNKKLKKQGNTSRILILILLLWAIGLTVNQYFITHPKLEEIPNIESAILDYSVADIPIETLTKEDL